MAESDGTIFILEDHIVSRLQHIVDAPIAVSVMVVSALSVAGFSSSLDTPSITVERLFPKKTFSLAEDVVGEGFSRQVVRIDLFRTGPAQPVAGSGQRLGSVEAQPGLFTARSSTVPEKSPTGGAVVVAWCRQKPVVENISA